MPRTSSVQARLGLLAVTGIAANLAVALTAVLALNQVASSAAAVDEVDALLASQQQAELQLADLRHEVGDLAREGVATDATSLAATTRTAERLRAALPATDDGVRALGDPALAGQVAGARAVLEAQAVGSERLVALLTTDPAAGQAALPALEEQADRAQVQMAALTGALREHVREAEDEAEALGARATSRIWWTVVLGLLLPIVVCGTVVRSVQRSVTARAQAERGLREANARLTADTTRERFDAVLKDAFDMAVTEPEAHEVVRRAVLASVPGHRAELLLADNSQAHLSAAMTEPGDDAPGCGVASPRDCIAVRRGRPAVFESADGIGACPKLAGRVLGSAACSPVTFLGEGLGVLHVVSSAGTRLEPDALRDLAVTAEQAGNRIGTLRAFDRSQLQAHTDGLTGLLNRRTVEERTVELQRGGRRLTLALCDLDHFKTINDTYGHEAGDRALRVFSAVLRSVVRDVDLVARYGGEEFLLVLPDCSLSEAGQVVQRVRQELALALHRGGTPTFTASFGLALLVPDQSLDDGVRVADGALLQAKAEGRDRVVVAAV